MWTQKGEFIIGEQEKHRIYFNLSRWWGRFSVKVDGKEDSLINNKLMVSGPFTLEVGEKEKHTVTFQLLMPAIFPAFKKTKIQVLVDNKLYKSF